MMTLVMDKTGLLFTFVNSFISNCFHHKNKQKDIFIEAQTKP